MKVFISIIFKYLRINLNNILFYRNNFVKLNKLQLILISLINNNS